MADRPPPAPRTRPDRRDLRSIHCRTTGVTMLTEPPEEERESYRRRHSRRYNRTNAATFRAFRIVNEDGKIHGSVIDATLDELSARRRPHRGVVFERELQGRARRHRGGKDSAPLPADWRHRRRRHRRVELGCTISRRRSGARHRLRPRRCARWRICGLRPCAGGLGRPACRAISRSSRRWRSARQDSPRASPWCGSNGTACARRRARSS